MILSSAWILALLLTACTAPQSSTLTTERLDPSAVLRFWETQDQLAEGEPVDEAAWDALFATPAYEWQAHSQRIRDLIRGRMELAFQPDRQPLEEVLASAEGYDVIRWTHYMRMRDEREQLGAYLTAVMASDVVDDALVVAQRYLPPGVVQTEDWSTQVHFLLFGPDALTDSGAIYFDLIEAADRGPRMYLLLAHEFHHDFYAKMNPLPKLMEDDKHYWTSLAITKLHMEGIADRIDKGDYPLPQRKGGAPGYIDDFNKYYRVADETLAEFDAALARVATADDPDAAAREAWSLLHYSGHVEGLFMAHTVADAQGAEVLLDDVGDPFAFLRRFQSVHPTFSADTLAYIASVEADVRGE